MMRPKRLGFRNDDILAVLLVIVPAGPDQRDQLLAAIRCFEEAAATRLGSAFDTTFRDIEDDNPRCRICRQNADWSLGIESSGATQYFCTVHAQEQPTFDYDSQYFFWRQLSPVSTSSNPQGKANSTNHSH